MLLPCGRPSGSPNGEGPSPVKKLRRLRRLGREALILTGFSIAMWGLLYLPLGFILGFDIHQWLVWFGVTTWYDIPADYAGARIIIWFNDMARRRGWYGKRPPNYQNGWYGTIVVPEPKP